MKRILCCLFACMLVLNLVGCGGASLFGTPLMEPVLVCKKVDAEDIKNIPDNVFQSLHNYAGDMAICKNFPSQKVDTAYFLVQYKTTENVIDKYVKMLTQNGFTLIEKDDDPYLSDCKWSLRCDTAKDAYPLADYDDNCHLEIEGYSSGKFFVKYSGDLLMQDLGFRIDGNHIDVFGLGKSATAGLYIMPDGSFQTSDGRLNAQLNKATVIRDGKKLKADAHYNLNNSEWLMVNEYHRNEDFFFAVDPEYTVQGDYYWCSSFVEGRYSFVDGDADRVMDNGHGENPFFVVAANNHRYGPTQTDNRFESLFVRVMYYKEDETAVYYVYAKLKDSEPSEIEALCAISLKVEEAEEEKQSGGSSIFDKDECGACFGDGKCNTCGGSGTKRTWTGDSYITQDCTGAFCNNGRCNQCGGDGER